jgi:chemotaxis protein CheD
MSPSHGGNDIFLQPGQYHVGGAGCRIRTLLGSCVSITLWHPVMKVGAMSHFLLPGRNVGWPSEPDARYGEEAMWLMLRDLVRAGANPLECSAKIFGGGNMFPEHAKSGTSSVGERNGNAARAMLQRHGIRVASASLFGEGHRQIIFHVASGHVWARQIKPIATGSWPALEVA